MCAWPGAGAVLVVTKNNLCENEKMKNICSTW